MITSWLTVTYEHVRPRTHEPSPMRFSEACSWEFQDVSRFLAVAGLVCAAMAVVFWARLIMRARRAQPDEIPSLQKLVDDTRTESRWSIIASLASICALFFVILSMVS